MWEQRVTIALTYNPIFDMIILLIPTTKCANKLFVVAKGHFANKLLKNAIDTKKRDKMKAFLRFEILLFILYV